METIPSIMEIPAKPTTREQWLEYAVNAMRVTVFEHKATARVPHVCVVKAPMKKRY